MLPRRGVDPQPVGFASADAELVETLDSLDGAENYADWIFALLAPHLGPEVLELGSGHGTFTQRLVPGARRVTAVELSERCVDVLRGRFADDPSVKIYQGGMDQAIGHGPYDTAVLINVLEHIEDDNAALDQLVSVLNPGGRLILWVPAFPALYSEFDRKIGHHRRYKVAGLRAQLVERGLDPVDIRYVNAVGAVGWMVLARWLRRTPTIGTPVKIFDRYLIPVLRRVEGRVPMPFGQSVFAVGVKR